MKTGQPAPKLELDDCLGQPFRQPADKGLVITFFRGAW